MNPGKGSVVTLAFGSIVYSARFQCKFTGKSVSFFKNKGGAKKEEVPKIIKIEFKSTGPFKMIVLQGLNKLYFPSLLSRVVFRRNSALL